MGILWKDVVRWKTQVGLIILFQVNAFHSDFQHSPGSLYHSPIVDDSAETSHHHSQTPPLTTHLAAPGEGFSYLALKHRHQPKPPDSGFKISHPFS